MMRFEKMSDLISYGINVCLLVCLLKLGLSRSFLVECLGLRSHQSFGENSLVSKAAVHCTVMNFVNFLSGLVLFVLFVLFV